MSRVAMSPECHPQPAAAGTSQAVGLGVGVPAPGDEEPPLLRMTIRRAVDPVPSTNTATFSPTARSATDAAAPFWRTRVFRPSANCWLAPEDSRIVIEAAVIAVTVPRAVGAE